MTCVGEIDWSKKVDIVLNECKVINAYMIWSPHCRWNNVSIVSVAINMSVLNCVDFRRSLSTSKSCPCHIGNIMPMPDDMRCQGLFRYTRRASCMWQAWGLFKFVDVSYPWKRSKQWCSKRVFCKYVSWTWLQIAKIKPIPSLRIASIVYVA